MFEYANYGVISNTGNNKVIFYETHFCICYEFTGECKSMSTSVELITLLECNHVTIYIDDANFWTKSV